MNILYTYPETIVDGEGIRYSIYFAGCRHHCPECHNCESWDAEAGELLTEERMTQIINDINSNPLLDGITLSGGDPLYNPVALLPIVKRLKEETSLGIWCYTGYRIEEIREQEELAAILPYIDVLVDGRFVESLYSPYLEFRGSSNQRVIRL